MLEFLKVLFLVLQFSCYILMTFLMMLSVILLTLLMMILLSILSFINHLIYGSNLNWLLNLNLIYDWGKKWLVDFNSGKNNWFCLTGLITMVLLMRGPLNRLDDFSITMFQGCLCQQFLSSYS